MSASNPVARPQEAPQLIILGASNIVADHLVRRLIDAGRPMTAIARRPVAVPSPGRSIQVDVMNPGDWRIPPGAEVVSILPLAVLAKALPLLDRADSIVAIGSTSLLGKAASADPKDRATAASLAAAEASLGAFCDARGIPLTVLRPTLVYDGLGDRNIARLVATIRRLGLLPVAAPAKGLRQPIHADDVALAILAAQHNARAKGLALNIGGGETLTYRAMVERIFAAMGRRPRVLPLPAVAIEAAYRLRPLAARLEASGLSRAVFTRMNEDLVFDVAPGLDILGLAPRPFTLPDLR